jgi:hypothetical protein
LERSLSSMMRIQPPVVTKELLAVNFRRINLGG